MKRHIFEYFAKIVFSFSDLCIYLDKIFVNHSFIHFKKHVY